MRGVAADVAKTAALSPPRAWATLSGPDRRSDAPRTHDGKEAGMKRRDFLKHGTTAVAAAGALGVPALLRAQGVIKVGHMTPRTDLLGQQGAYAVMGAQQAVDEANARGTSSAGKIEPITDDTPNPGVAVTEAQRLIERDRATFLLGEISSASGLAISEIAHRSNILYFNTRWN